MLFQQRGTTSKQTQALQGNRVACTKHKRINSLLAQREYEVRATKHQASGPHTPGVRLLLGGPAVGISTGDTSRPAAAPHSQAPCASSWTDRPLSRKETTESVQHLDHECAHEDLEDLELLRFQPPFAVERTPTVTSGTDEKATTPMALRRTKQQKVFLLLPGAFL